MLYGFQRMKYDDDVKPNVMLKFDNVESALEYLERKKKRNETIALNRARDNIKDIILSNMSPKSYFLTLTFADNVTEYKEAIKHWYKFIRWFKTQFRYELRYLVVVERQERGAIHYHCLLFNARYIKDLQWLESKWGQGAINYKYVKDWSRPDVIARYLGDYLTESSIDGKKYFTSKNIIKPKVDISNETPIDKLMEALQSPQSHVRVKSTKYSYISYVKTTS